MAFVLAAFILAIVHNLILGTIEIGSNNASYKSIKANNKTALLKYSPMSKLVIKTVKKQL